MGDMNTPASPAQMLALAALADVLAVTPSPDVLSDQGRRAYSDPTNALSMQPSDGESVEAFTCRYVTAWHQRINCRRRRAVRLLHRDGPVYAHEVETFLPAAV